MIASACQIVLELILGELEPDQCLEARAQHRFADVGLRQRIDRGIDVSLLSLSFYLVAYFLFQLLLLSFFFLFFLSPLLLSFFSCFFFFLLVSYSLFFFFCSSFLLFFFFLLL